MKINIHSTYLFVDLSLESLKREGPVLHCFGEEENMDRKRILLHTQLLPLPHGPFESPLAKIPTLVEDNDGACSFLQVVLQADRYTPDQYGPAILLKQTNVEEAPEIFGPDDVSGTRGVRWPCSRGRKRPPCL